MLQILVTKGKETHGRFRRLKSEGPLSNIEDAGNKLIRGSEGLKGDKIFSKRVASKII